MQIKMMLVVIMTDTCIFKYLTPITATIDINAAELQYLADHLTSEECRKLVAAAHFPNYQLINALSEAELRITKDLSCFDLLLHWNSSPGEGKGKSHEALEHRLRQLGKYQLADRLGKTVFDEIGRDMEKSLEEGLDSSENGTGVTLEPLIDIPTAKYEDPTEWVPADSLMFAALLIVVGATFCVCLKVCYTYTCGKVFQARSKSQPKYTKIQQFSDTSDSESDEKFNVQKAHII